MDGLKRVKREPQDPDDEGARGPKQAASPAQEATRAHIHSLEGQLRKLCRLRGLGRLDPKGAFQIRCLEEELRKAHSKLKRLLNEAERQRRRRERLRSGPRSLCLQQSRDDGGIMAALKSCTRFQDFVRELNVLGFTLTRQDENGDNGESMPEVDGVKVQVELIEGDEELTPDFKVDCNSSSSEDPAPSGKPSIKTMAKSKENSNETEDLTPANPEEVDLIDVMNNLQNKLIASGHSLDVNLPQIAVVGAQSAGKSSVLENIVGKEFLPRGKGVVTRRPILIQLFPTRGEEYGVFGHKPEFRFSDFNAIKKEIEEQMPTGTHPDQNSKCFSSVPIQLKIYSPRVLKLTLVDLPGLVRVAVDGHSPDSVSEVREMVLKYISQPECIILAVSPANQDLATSDALEIAKVADPTRERTIGVITKLDRMEACTDARKVLENREIQLRRGYIGVINRSQQDIEEGRDIDYILEKEKKFFSEEPAYKDMAHKMGTPYLRRMLQKTLRLHIKGALPDTRAAIAEKLSKLDRQLEELNIKIGGDGKGGQFYMLRLVTDFIQDINTELMGNSEMIKLGQISSGALINYKLNTEVLSYLRLSLVPKPEDLTALITSLHGIRTSLSFPSLALDAINRKLVAEYEYPLQRSVDCIRKVLEDAVVKSSELMNGYPSMQNEVIYRIREQIKEEATKTYSRLKDHVHAEMFYVNLEHPDLDLSVCENVVPTIGPTKVWDVQAAENNAATVDSKTSNDQLMHILMQNEPTQKKVQYIMLVMTKYLEIVQKQMVDVAIKYIVSFLIKKVLDFMKKDLIPTLLSSPNFASFTEDCEQDFRLKDDMEKTAACLREALDAIQSF